MSFYDKSDLYFYDYNLAGLFVQENYLQSKPAAAGGDKKKLMELVSKAADSMAQGDLVEKGIRSGMNWGLLPTAAVFCSVLPGEYMEGKFVHCSFLSFFSTNYYLRISYWADTVSFMAGQKQQEVKDRQDFAGVADAHKIECRGV